ncbi:uncharacterized protein LOC142235915 [Haematobia irritans]|uniref:uncharacterized protein LOC142235915 n=1 Tax=Haematobia irritans TaxID=7368 RepID=UPI003F4FBAEB
MDTLSPNLHQHHKDAKISNSSSSGCSAASSTTDIKSSLKNQRPDGKTTGLRSRSFLLCLGKHLGRHFNHHHHSQQQQHRHHHHTINHNGHIIVYNSQEDLRSSSTDSFSLSYERNSRLDGSMANGNPATSSIDLSCDEMNSRTSSASACSRFSPDQELDMENCSSNQPHIYISTTIYRANSSLDCHDDLDDYSEADSGNSSSDENNDGDDDHKENLNENINNTLKVNPLKTQKSKSTPTSASNTPSCSLTTSSSKGLHLSRVSITSSVRSMFQHISSVSGVTTRSLSCSSTPLRRVWNTKCRKTQSNPSTANDSNKSSASSSSASSNSNKKQTSASSSSSKKPEKKQQSILRPPIQYVYMKGMSGLYSRVPSYTVCCPYGTKQWA